MGKGIVAFIVGWFLSALLRLESELIVAECMDASVIRGSFRVRNARTRKIPYELGKFVTNSEKAPNHTGVPTCRNIFHLWISTFPPLHLTAQKNTKSIEIIGIRSRVHPPDRAIALWDVPFCQLM
jgi:hypothetical protein